MAVPISLGLLRHDAERLCYLVSKTRETLFEPQFVWGEHTHRRFSSCGCTVLLLSSVFGCRICGTRKNDVLLLGADKILEGTFLRPFKIVTYIVTPNVTSRENLYTRRA